MNVINIAKELEFEVKDVEVLLTLFVKNAQQSIDELYNAVKNNNSEQIAFFAHSIKGSASNLLLEDIAKDALYIEQSAKANESIPYVDAIKKLEKQIKALKKAMAQ